MSRPLPPPDTQIEKLIVHLRELAEDSHLGEVTIEDKGALCAIVGAADDDSLAHLIEWAIQTGLLNAKSDLNKMSLTPKAWAGDAVVDPPKISTRPSDEPDKRTMKETRGHCPNCGPDRRASVKASHRDGWDDSESGFWAFDTYNILKCGGCDTVYVQHEHIFSEDIDYQRTPDGGWEQVASPTTKYWPSPAKRSRPEWLDGIEDDPLRTVLVEVYGALDLDHRILAAIGARTSLDRAMVLLGATPEIFPRMLAELEEKGIVSPHEKDQLLVLTDAGNASAHRAWHPTPENLDTVMSGMESFLNRTLVFGKSISAVRKDIPARPKPLKGDKQL